MHPVIQDRIEFIQKNACPSIRYRMQKEILHEPTDFAGMLSLQQKILDSARVKKAFALQRDDGFIGTVLHGAEYDGFDSTVMLMKRYGVEITDPRMQAAKESLISWTDYERDHFYKAGNAMDEHGRGGFRAILADMLAELGANESQQKIQQQISAALYAFEGALLHKSVDDFSVKATFRGNPCRYYIKGTAFPAANHVSILEKTMSWRTEENLAMVRQSYRHCQKLMKDYSDGIIYVNCGYFVGPFNHNWTIEVPHRIAVSDFADYPINFAWFMKGLSAASVRQPVFCNEDPLLLESLLEWLADDHFTEQLSDEQLRLFKKYASIEPSWRKKESVLCDLYFPLLLALSKRGCIYA